ncbi:MFS transporter [Salisaeta longa]|uniref:MFS transporter n=1 Tax=Salisaeta longa TaxID=503170 RepID=UPI0003B34057|nr:MFS transporter [Salisaeta longa]
MATHTSHDVSVADNAGYAELIVGNGNFRRLWIGTLISLLGDWFNTIALYTLVTTLTGSPLALGAVFITKMLPWAVVSPLAGVIVDRFNRRRLMIGADIARAVVVLGFLLIDQPGEVGWLYVLIAAQVVIGSVFQPAKSAALPNVTTPRELLTANALMSATWSTMLAVGAALGGLATEWLGPEAVFWIDSASYLVSAVFIAGTRIPQDTDAPQGSMLRSAAREITDGWRHLRTHPRIGRIAFAKATWAAGGGALVYLLALLGNEVAPGAIAAGIGVLFMARGIGTGIGPVVVRALFTDEKTWPRVMGAAIAACGLCYAAVVWVPWTTAWQHVTLICALIIVAHGASGGNWTVSSVLLQKRTEDRYRGRVFSTDWLLVMTAESVSIFTASLLLEAGWLTLVQSFLVFGGLQVACGLAWLAIVVPRERAADDAARQAP